MSKRVFNVLLIFIGNLMLALGVVAFVNPFGFILGGAGGIGLILEHYTGISYFIFVYAFNIAVFVVGLIVLGKKFAMGTAISTVLFPTFLAVLENIPGIDTLTSDPLLAGFFASICIGGGVGLVIRLGASTGGTDIPSIIIANKTKISLSIVLNTVDVAILALQFSFSNSEQILYGLFIVILNFYIIDKVMMIGTSKIQVQIISPSYLDIREAIYENIDRGCTLYKITTGFQQQQSYAVMSVVSNRQLHNLTEVVLKIDPTAFIISNVTHSVNGRGFTLPDLVGKR